MTNFEQTMIEAGVVKYPSKALTQDNDDEPATPLQGYVRDALKNGLERISRESKINIKRQSRMGGMYNALYRLRAVCSMDRVTANGIFKRD